MYQLNTQTSAKALLEHIGVDKGSMTILSDKMRLFYIKIEKMHVAAANILKQDALSIGADLAVPKGVVTCEVKEVDALLIATKKQLRLLAKKELAQPFGLKTLAHYLADVVKQNAHDHKKRVKVMGVINANDDSFFQGSRFTNEKAIERIEQMISDGAAVIDIGGVSSRPGSVAVSASEELRRVRPILDAISEHSLYEKVDFSIDSYEPIVIEYALRSGFTIVNDITGLEDDRVCEIAAKYNATVVIMHMLGRPKTMQENPKYSNVIDDVNTFFSERIDKAKVFGIKEIVLDIGIGFGKSLEDNLALLKHLEAFSSHGYEILVGASRKSMIDTILPTPIEERLPATLALHLEAVRNGATYIRCHDVKEHVQALSIINALTQSSIF